MQASSKLPHIVHWSNQRATERKAQLERRAEKQKQRQEKAKKVK